MDVIANWLGDDNREKVHSRESKESETASQAVLEVENVSRRYENAGHENRNSVFAVNDVSFRIPQGSFVGIMGASGSGKTTLLHLIATIDRPTSGTIRISGQNIVDIPEEAAAEFRRRHLGFVLLPIVLSALVLNLIAARRSACYTLITGQSRRPCLKAKEDYPHDP